TPRCPSAPPRRASAAHVRMTAPVARGAAAPRPSAERVPGVVDELEATLLERLLDGERGVVDPRLLLEHRLRVEALVEHALDDLLTDVLGLRADLVRVLEDLALGGDELGGDLVTSRVGRPGERDVRRQLPWQLRRASL